MISGSGYRRYLFFVVCIMGFTVQIFADETFDKLMSSGKYKEAVDYADEKLSPSDRTPVLWAQLGQANESIGLTEKALACFLVAWRMSPNDYNTLLGAARIYNKINQPDNAITMAKKALDINFTAEASWEYARACISLNRSAEAKKALEKVIQADSSNAIANRELGNIYFAEKGWVQAIPLLKKQYRSVQDGMIAYKIGKSYVEIGVADSALKYLKESVSRGGPAGASLDLARAYFEQKNYKEALVQYEKATESEMVADDFYKIGISREKVQDNPNALIAFEKAVNLYGNSRSNEAILARGKLGKGMLKDNRFDKALEQFGFIVAADPKGIVFPEIYFLLAEAQQGKGDKEKAISSLESAIALNSRNIEAYARLAELYQKNGMEDKAKSIYETLLNLSPNDPNVYLSLGVYNIKLKKYSDALSQFEKSNTLRKSASASEGIAIAAYNLNQVDKARDAAKIALSLDAGSWDARVILVSILMKDKNYSAAREHLEYILQKDSYQIEYAVQLATCYLQTGEKEKLVDLDKKIALMDKKNVESRLRLAQYAESKNDALMAIPYYEELSVITPQAADIFRKLSAAYLKSGNQNNAIAYLRRYLQLVPNDAVAHRDLGDYLYDKKNFDDALIEYKTAIKLDPAIKGFYKKYADIVIAKGQQDEVISTLTSIVNAGEADLGTYTTLGMIFQKKKIFGRAIEMYQKALQLEPANVDALVALGSCQAQNGDLSAAVISYEQAVMMNNQAVSEFKDLGEIYFRLGREEEGIKAYKKYLDKSPNDADVAIIVGRRAYERKEFADVAKYLSGLGDNAAPDYLIMYAEACMNTQKYKTAIEVLEKLKSKKIKGTFQYTIYKMTAEAYEMDSNGVEAANAYADYLALPGVKEPDAAYKSGSLQEKQNPVLAQKIYEENIKVYPADYRNFLRLGLLYSQKKETLQKAITMLMKVTDLASSVPSVWLELARVYGRMEKSAEELYAYQKYSETDPQNLEANRRMGIIQMQNGKNNEAVVYLEIANAQQPGDPQVLVALANGYVKLKRTAEAIDLLIKAKAVKKNDSEIRFQLFTLYKESGQEEKALNEMKELIELKRETQYLMIYADALTDAGKYKDAENIIEDILATEAENIEVLLLKAKILRIRKKYDDAVEVYKEIQTISPENVQSLFERAETHLLQSKLPWAETFYTRALRADPKFALAELGLAKIAKIRKNNAAYTEHLEKARQLDPENKIILEELKSNEK